MEKQTRNVFGIIHIGTVNMTLKVIAYSSLDDMEIIENVSREVKYGETVFQRHHVRSCWDSASSFATMMSKMSASCRRQSSAKPTT